MILYAPVLSPLMHYINADGQHGRSLNVGVSTKMLLAVGKCCTKWRPVHIVNLIQCSDDIVDEAELVEFY